MMSQLLKAHLWVIILVIGGVVLVIQKNQNQWLEAQLPEVTSKEMPQFPPRSSLSSSRRSDSILKRVREISSAKAGFSFADLVAEFSSLTSSELACLISDPKLNEDESLQRMCRFLNLLHRALDPGGALGLEQPGGSSLDLTRLSATRTVFGLLAMDSPDSAERWLSQIDRGKLKESFEKQLRKVQFLDDPGANIQDIGTLFPRHVPIFPPEKLEGLLIAIDSIEDQKIRSSAITSLLVSSAIEDPVLARSRAEALSLSPAELEETFNQLAEYQEMGSPELLEWTLTFPHDSFQGCQDQLFSNYAQRDPEGAVEWLENLEAPAETMDIFFSRYAALMSMSSPREAMKWAERISSPELRERE